MTRWSSFFITLTLVACTTQAGPPITTTVPTKPEIIRLAPPTLNGKTLPFAEGVRVGHLLFLSGQIGNLPGTMTLAAGGIQAETRQTMENIQVTLKKFGASMNDVVKCTVFIADMAEWPAMNQVYVTYFENPPARSALGVSGLALGARVEIECIAVLEA